ncbi:Ig-like domain repeat protein [Streptomyces sp. NPDC048718]|uniref:RCC1 domain-containing protein n=1 Tax=Streptomyces sp. NPDC048718 TaxID=3365587 RepID=UPI00371E31F1
MRSRPGDGRARVLLRTLVAMLAAALYLAGFAAPPASAAAPPASPRVPSPVAPTDIALAWGWNESGQLGDGTTTDRDLPVRVELPAGIRLTSLKGGGRFTLGLTSDGRVLAWGNNDYGQLGDGTTTRRPLPIEVDLPAGVRITAISAGTNFGLALTSDGRVLGWGDNPYGQLGDGTTTSRLTPVYADIPAGTEITALTTGANHTLATTADGRFLSWGSNSAGQLGDGTHTNRTTPVEVNLPAGTRVTDFTAGYSHSVVLTSDGRVLAWGSNNAGQLGDGTFVFNSTTPVETLIPAGTEVTALSAGNGHTLALTAEGGVLAWGWNAWGQLGDGTTTDRRTPVEPLIPAGTRVASVVAGYYHSMVLTSGNHVLAFGYGFNGQLGNGAMDVTDTPVETLIPAGLHVTALAAGELHSLALADAAASTTTLTASPTTAAPGAPVTLTAHVTCNVDTPTGDVAFFSDGTPIGTAPLDASGEAILTTSALPLGTHPITAHYEGDDTCPASTSEPVTVTIEQAPAGALHLTKQATSSGPFEVGDTVEYAYTVTNSGESALGSVAVTDDRVTDVDCGTTTLAPGESTSCRGTYVVTEADAVCGPRGDNGRGDGGYGDHGTTCPVTNTAQATATDAQGDTITSDTATATIQVTTGNGDGGHDGYDAGYDSGAGSDGYAHGRGKKAAKSA